MRQRTLAGCGCDETSHRFRSRLRKIALSNPFMRPSCEIRTVECSDYTRTGQYSAMPSQETCTKVTMLSMTSKSDHPFVSRFGQAGEGSRASVHTDERYWTDGNCVQSIPSLRAIGLRPLSRLSVPHHPHRPILRMAWKSGKTKALPMKHLESTRGASNACRQ